MIQEFVGFDAYEAACGRDSGLLGFSPIDTALWLKIALQDVLRAVEDGFLDLCRIVNLDGSVLLIVPLASICRFRFPYLVETWKHQRKYRRSHGSCSCCKRIASEAHGNTDLRWVALPPGRQTS